MQRKHGNDNKDGHHPYWDWALLLYIIIFVLVVRVRLLGVPLERDEGEYAYAGRLILEGIFPYDQIYNMKMPGIYGAYAVILAIFPKSHYGIHLGLLVINIATIILIFLLAKRLFGSASVARALPGIYSLLSY